MPSPLRWWQKSTIYQILIPSFQDTNGDGWGDLPGVLQRLDYLEWLGAGAIWLSPIYPSPLEDIGYDVSGHRDVHPLFGTLDDFDRLVAAAHERGIRIILDWVPNHTSDRHPWFLESRSRRDAPKREWYIWRDGKPDGSLPNNWLSVFGGSGWEWDEATGQFYYHSFLESQPDLNWRNEEVQDAMFEAMRFWLARGADGFRMDAASWMIKDDRFRDNPPNPNYRPERDGPDQRVTPIYTWGQPGVHSVLAKMRRVMDEFDDRLLTGELVLPINAVVTYYGETPPELHLPFNLHLMWTDWKAEGLGRVIREYAREVEGRGWPTWTLSTHDFSRLALRARGEQVRVAAMLLLTLGGSPTHYYGEELGMHGVPIPPEQARDPQGRRIGRNRDPARTPMQWDGSPRAGFTAGDPWLPVGEDRAAVNVEGEMNDPRSLLNLYRSLLELRRESPVLLSGAVEVLKAESALLVYERRGDDQKYLVALNFSDRPQACLTGRQGLGRVLLSTYLDREGEETGETLDLRADEGVVMVISG